MKELHFKEFENIMLLLEKQKDYDSLTLETYIKLLPLYNELKNKKNWLQYNGFIGIIPKNSKRNGI